MLVLLLSALLLPAPAITHIEQDDPRITYTGTWYPNTNSLNSSGASVLANLKGSQAVVAFNGTGITWLGTSDPFSGYALVTLDGVQTQVDTANATSTLYQQPLFAVHGLASGPHNLTIEITHSHDEASNQSWIWVDGFDIDDGAPVAGGFTASPGLVEQTNAAVTYGGHWFTTNSTQDSGGSVTSAVDTGAWVNLQFTGTGVNWIAYRDEWSGVAQVFIDGASQGNVDTYLAPSQPKMMMYSVVNLPNAAHTLKIVTTGTQNPKSGGPWIWVDAFNVTGTASPLIVNAGGIVDAASYASTVAPGQIISVFGGNFGRADAASLPLPTTLGGVAMTACGRTVPMYNVFPAQINAQLPVECATTGTAQLTVTVGGQSATQTLNLASASPGIFTIGATGTGDAVIFHGDNTLVSAANPAKAGEQVVIYCSGLGATSPAFATGAAASSDNQLSTPVTVSIGGKVASVVHASLTVGFVGLYQVNAIVPAGFSGAQPIMLNGTSRAGVNVAVTP